MKAQQGFKLSQTTDSIELVNHANEWWSIYGQKARYNGRVPDDYVLTGRKLHKIPPHVKTIVFELCNGKCKG